MNAQSGQAEAVIEVMPAIVHLNAMARPQEALVRHLAEFEAAALILRITRLSVRLIRLIIFYRFA
ncbi:protein of unknown function [Paraburkholderia dioscoreae]|uniref:Uncharacterized protein n=1 Tax=Paraburkholderia dioscoreae TaxID=2604047 RepID=A0A5Q4ZCA1_9BURK|nr:protein of unknown function [Paraburkholderia dioscoreae]